MTRPIRRLLPILLISLATGCPSQLSLPNDVHVFGQYQTCLRRVSDTCGDADAGCHTQPASTHPMLVGVRRGTSEFLVAREGLEPVAGVLEGTLFRVETTEQLPDVCGCPAEVVEVIEGELLALPMGEISCGALVRDGGTCGAPAPDAGESEPPDAGEPDAGEPDAGEPDAGEPDAGLDFEQRYPAIRGRVTNEVRATGEGDCPCLPCRTEFELVGRP